MTEGYVRKDENGFYVGAADKERNYTGPEAYVSADKTWLHIVTDPYEGVVMLNIEAAIFLVEAIYALMEGQPK